MHTMFNNQIKVIDPHITSSRYLQSHFIFVVLGMESGALGMLDKHSNTEIHLQTQELGLSLTHQPSVDSQLLGVLLSFVPLCCLLKYLQIVNWKSEAQKGLDCLLGCSLAIPNLVLQPSTASRPLHPSASTRCATHIQPTTLRCWSLNGHSWESCHCSNEISP